MLQVAIIAEFEDLNALLLLLVHGLDPLVRLTLWINVQRPSARLVRNDGVLNRECIRWQTIDTPVLDLHGVSECLCKTEASRVWNFLINANLDPAFDELISVKRIECAKIGDHA